jgi:hypothetical protein
MTYFKKVSPKIALRLVDRNYEENTTKYLVGCCGFHGCNFWSPHKDYVKFCKEYGKEIISSFSANKKYYTPFTIHHYARSLEKYELKTRTWVTANGENTGYNILGYLDRAVGWELDVSAVDYGCQVRNVLSSMTNEDIYLRPGEVWMRNLEFGKNMTYYEKGRRNGLVEAGYKHPHKNPYHYHGYYNNPVN